MHGLLFLEFRLVPICERGLALPLACAAIACMYICRHDMCTCGANPSNHADFNDVLLIYLPIIYFWIQEGAKEEGRQGLENTSKSFTGGGGQNFDGVDCTMLRKAGPKVAKTRSDRTIITS